MREREREEERAAGFFGGKKGETGFPLGYYKIFKVE